jgi:hypothetical protein
MDDTILAWQMDKDMQTSQEIVADCTSLLQDCMRSMGGGGSGTQLQQPNSIVEIEGDKQ